MQLRWPLQLAFVTAYTNLSAGEETDLFHIFRWRLAMGVPARNNKENQRLAIHPVRRGTTEQNKSDQV
jgi:hypothetical protein